MRRLAFFRKLIGAPDLVFDVGANVGTASRLFRTLGARVVAFEPSAECARALAKAFAHDPGFTHVQSALSDREGEALLHVGESSVLSTIDEEWMARMNAGGRFAGQWDHTESITLTTLDRALEQHGVPSFIKIDVEGHEHRVVAGLSHPIALISLEFASESLASTIRCIEHLEALAKYEYQLSLGTSSAFESRHWCDASQLRVRLKRAVRRDPLAWGDLYARQVRSPA